VTKQRWCLLVFLQALERQVRENAQAASEGRQAQEAAVELRHR
jgi:hypothetical protein